MSYKEIYDIVWNCFLTSYEQDEQWGDEETAKLIARKIKEKSEVEERILCAAVWYKDFDAPVHTCTNTDKGVVLCGYRHGHIFGQLKALTGTRSPLAGESVQGFLTSKGRFLDREEALELFESNGNESEFGDELYSEDLY